MAQQQLRLTDAATADTTLRFLSSSDEPVTLHLRSPTLRRFQYFEGRFLRRRPNLLLDPHDPYPHTIEITLPDRKRIAACTRCIELMDAPTVDPTFFTSVRDALEVLEQAAEFAFDDCVNACLCYLEGVMWSAEDETLIRSSLASLDAKIPVDLADRLSSSDCDRAKMMEDRLTEMFSQVSRTSFQSSSMIRKCIETQVRKNVHPAVRAVFGSLNNAILYKEWNRNLDLIRTKQVSKSHYKDLKFSKQDAVDMACRLEWLLQTLLSLKIGVDAVKTFAQEDTAKLLVEYRGAYMLNYIMKAFENGELIISRPIRLALVKTWLPRLQDIIGPLRIHLAKSFRAIIKTFPQADQTEIFVTWFSTCFQTETGFERGNFYEIRWPLPNLEEVFELSCDELRQAQDT